MGCQLLQKSLTWNLLECLHKIQIHNIKWFTLSVTVVATSKNSSRLVARDVLFRSHTGCFQSGCQLTGSLLLRLVLWIPSPYSTPMWVRQICTSRVALCPHFKAWRHVGFSPLVWKFSLCQIEDDRHCWRQSADQFSSSILGPISSGPAAASVNYNSTDIISLRHSFSADSNTSSTFSLIKGALNVLFLTFAILTSSETLFPLSSFSCLTVPCSLFSAWHMQRRAACFHHTL
jgi:hypothetical protein